MGDVDAVLHYALVERESSWIPTLACDILVQPPLGLLVAWVTQMKPSTDGSRLSEVVMMVLPKLKIAPIGQELIDCFAKQKAKLRTLSPVNLKSLGASALAPAGKLLILPERAEAWRSGPGDLDERIRFLAAPGP